MYQSFDEECQSILLKAIREKEILKDEFIGSEHILLAILNSENSISILFKKIGITYSNFKEKLEELTGPKKNNKTWNLYTPFLKKVFADAILKAKENHSSVTLPILVQSLIETGDGLALRTLSAMNVDLHTFMQLFITTVKKDGYHKEHHILDSFGRNLLAEVSSFDPVIGREEEINLLIKTLCKRKKSNPILLGEAGVGKTALVEELARRISQNKVPSELLNKKIYSLETSTLVAGTKYRGEFEERFSQLIKEIEEDPDIILFIDEIHTLVGAGGAEGAIDASNILKPALARGKIKLIGATTIQEFNHYISKDKAFSRRFELIYILEPKKETLQEILINSAKKYEEFHNVVLEDGAIAKIIELSNQLNNDSHQPDKALDLLDEICTAKHIAFEQSLLSLMESITRISTQKNENIYQGNFKDALICRNKEFKLRESLEKKKMAIEKNIITIDDIFKYFEEKYQKEKISTVNLKLQLLKGSIHKKEQIKKLINSLPQASTFLFYGSSDTGKNYLAQKWINLMYPNQSFVIDMAEFQNEYDYNKLFGSPLGYKGCEEEPPLISFIKSNPYGLIYIKNISKASKKIFTAIVDILKKRTFQNNKGYILNVTQTFLFTISVQKKNIGFTLPSLEKDLQNQIPEMLLDQIEVTIPFEPLSDKEKIKILKIENDKINLTLLKELTFKLKTKKVSLSEGIKIVKKCKKETVTS